jgi:H-type small acid-soluble spore protein
MQALPDEYSSWMYYFFFEGNVILTKTKDMRDNMDIQRARQILNVDETITVLHHGSPIWIESVIPEDGTAMVKPVDGGEGVREVPVAELIEG